MTGKQLVDEAVRQIDTWGWTDVLYLRPAQPQVQNGGYYMLEMEARAPFDPLGAVRLWKIGVLPRRDGRFEVSPFVRVGAPPPVIRLPTA